MTIFRGWVNGVLYDGYAAYAEAGRRAVVPGDGCALRGISHPDPVWFEGSDGGPSAALERLVDGMKRREWGGA